MNDFAHQGGWAQIANPAGFAVEPLAYSDYRKILRDELARRVRQNPHYSLRAFARDLQIVPSRVSESLNNKQGLSRKAAEKIAARLRMPADKANLFLDLVTACHARSPKARHGAKLRLLRMNTERVETTTAGERVEKEMNPVFRHFGFVEHHPA